MDSKYFQLIYSINSIIPQAYSPGYSQHVPLDYSNKLNSARVELLCSINSQAEIELALQELDRAKCHIERLGFHLLPEDTIGQMITNGISKSITQGVLASIEQTIKDLHRRTEPKDVATIISIQKTGVIETENESQVTPADEDEHIIKGVRGLGKHLGCGVTKAQEILNSGILQKSGIAYPAGKGWRINREKLDKFLTENPYAFKGKLKKDFDL